MEHFEHESHDGGSDPRDGSAPSYDEVRRILAAAADVLFSDGVSDAFLDQWADETRLVMDLVARAAEPARSRRR